MTRANDLAHIGPGYQSSNRNWIINGNFDVAQRNVPGANDGYSLFDRWYQSSAANNVTFTRQTTTPLTGSRYYLRGTNTTSTAYMAITQALETANVTRLAGQTLTLSWWGRGNASSSTNGNATSEVFYSTSTDALLSQNTALASNLTYTFSANTWTKFTLTFTVPSTAVGLLIRIGQNNTMAANAVFDISQVQLELGSVATPFENRPIGTELALCQRYYFNGQIALNGMADNAGYCYGEYMFPVTMRTAPTITSTNTATSTYWSGGYGNATINTVASVALVGNNITVNGFTATSNKVMANANTHGAVGPLTFTANAEL